MACHTRLITALSALLAGHVPSAFAEDNANSPNDGTGSSRAVADTTGQSSVEMESGAPLAVTSQRQVLVRGLVDLDGLIQGNYLSGNSKDSGHRGYGLLRAEIGTSVILDPRITANVTFAYYDEAGSPKPTSTSTTTATPLPTVQRDRGGAVLDDAFVELKQSFGIQLLGVDAGRMPVCWNLRAGQGAFLYDSRANDPVVTSWDGARALYRIDQVDFTPYAYRLPDNSSLFGGGFDWKTATSGSIRSFVTGSINLERNVVLRPIADNPTPGMGQRLITYYAGAEVELNEFALYSEYAKQGGDQANGVRFNGWGANAGIDWRTHLSSGQQFVLGVKADYLSGDNDPTDMRNDAFINNWEGTSDCYIVESEKYGELSRYLQGNLEDVKVSAGVSFDPENHFRLNAIYGSFRSPRPFPGNAKGFGQEADLTLTWQYTHNATFRLLGGAFKPSSEFAQVAPAGKAVSKSDLVYLMGLNLAVVF